MSNTNEWQDLHEESTSTTQGERRQVSWTAVLAGLAPFLIWGLDLIVGEIPHNWAVPTWLPQLGGALFLSSLALPALGWGIGWMKSFPRWSYPYVGMELLTSLYMMHVATPGLRILGYTFGRKDLWGWRAWIPFLVMTAIALLLTRSLRPLLKLFSNAWEDWTLFTFGMFGFMPLLIAIGFDEVDRLYSLPFMIVLTCVMMGTAWAYLRSERQRQRILTLLVGILLTMTVVVVAPMAYWLPSSGVNVPWAIIMGALVVAVMFSPVLITRLRRNITPA